MDIIITPKTLCGHIQAISSKSQAHRLLICAAFSDKFTRLICPNTNEDIEATADCLRALGAKIDRTEKGYEVSPVSQLPHAATLNCHESGSTLRFMLPIVGALGIDTTFLLSGRLPERPLSPLWEEMERMGCRITRPTHTTIHCSGQLICGIYTIDGSVSSQFITGLLFAAALLPEKTTVEITGKTESKPYIQMTMDALAAFGVNCENYTVSSTRPFTSPGSIVIEGDWSNAAFFITACELGSDITTHNLNPVSAQGDRQIMPILKKLSGGNTEISCEDIPDLVPILSVAAAAMHGATFSGISRLRLKESDRVATVSNMLRQFGIDVRSDTNTMTVSPGHFTGCTVDAAGDHRIAMAAAIGATIASGSVTILGADCVKKSYPTFWDEYKKLGGQYEQHIR